MHYVFTLDGIKYVIRVDKDDYQILHQDKEYQDPWNSVVSTTGKRKFFLVPTFSKLQTKLRRWGKMAEFKNVKYPRKAWQVVLPRRLKTKEDLFIETL